MVFELQGQEKSAKEYKLRIWVLNLAYCIHPYKNILNNLLPFQIGLGLPIPPKKDRKKVPPWTAGKQLIESVPSRFCRLPFIQDLWRLLIFILTSTLLKTNSLHLPTLVIQVRAVSFYGR